MTLICRADRRRFTDTERASLHSWLERSPLAVCSCCGEPLAEIAERSILVQGSIGVGFAARLADEIGRIVPRPLIVVVRPTD